MPPPVPSRSPRPLTLSSGQIEVLFTWHGDRWHHSLHLRQADGTFRPACLQTAPATPDEDPNWPSSPALVELAEVSGPQGAAVVGVGKAGKTHFSASITAERDGGICFEIACRLTAPPGWLGSTYAASSGPRLTITPVNAVLQGAAAAPNGRPPSPTLVQIVPRTADHASRGGLKTASTIQWSYRVQAAMAGS